MTEIDPPELDLVRAAVNQQDLASMRSLAAFDVPTSHVIRPVEQNVQWHQQQIDQLASYRGPGHATAFIDTTTLKHAARCLTGEVHPGDLSAIEVFDLATFMTVAVMEDRILYLATPDRSIANLIALLGASVSFTSIDWKNDLNLRHMLNHLWAGSEQKFTRMVAQDRVFAHLDAWWSAAIGRKNSLARLRETWPGVDKTVGYREYFSSMEESATRMAIEDLDDTNDYALTKTGMDMGLFEELVVCAMMRGIFGYSFANALGVPYYSNGLRNGFRKLLFEQTHLGLQRVIGLPRTVQEIYFAHGMKEGDDLAPKVRTPLILSAVLRASSSTDDVIEQLVTWRKRAKPFRERRRELDEAIAQGDRVVIEKLRGAITKDADQLGSFAYATGDGTIARLLTAPGGARWWIGGLGSLMLGLGKVALPKEVEELLKKRLARPEFWFLTRLAADAQRLTEALEKLRMLRPKGGGAPETTGRRLKIRRGLFRRLCNNAHDLQAED